MRSSHMLRAAGAYAEKLRRGIYEDIMLVEKHRRTNPGLMSVWIEPGKNESIW